MTKQEHIDYWISNSKKDWKRAERCFRDKDYVFCLFFVHLSIEKICKGLWVKNNISNHPPRIHILETILTGAKVELSDEDWSLLINLNRFNLEGRYPDYKNMIYKETNKKFTSDLFSQSTKLKICLLKKVR